ALFVTAQSCGSHRCYLFMGGRWRPRWFSAYSDESEKAVLILRSPRARSSFSAAIRPRSYSVSSGPKPAPSRAFLLASRLLVAQALTTRQVGLFGSIASAIGPGLFVVAGGDVAA